MPRSGHYRSWGFTIIEVVVATAIALVTAAVVVQVLITTARTTEQTSSQADTQARARAALREWEKELRDGYAVLTDFTVPSGTEEGTVYETTASAGERTIVAAIPSIGTDGAPCTWRGVNVVFDCVVWRALKSGEGTDAVWDLTRSTFTDAFRMAPQYFTMNDGAPDPFRSLIWGQSSSSSGSVPYTMPAMGRQEGTESVFNGAMDVYVEFRNEAGNLLAPIGTVTEPFAAYPQPSPLPFVLDSAKNRTVPIRVTNVANIVISMEYQKKAGTLQTGKGEVTQSEKQSVTIRLRNKQTW